MKRRQSIRLFSVMFLAGITFIMVFDFKAARTDALKAGMSPTGIQQSKMDPHFRNPFFGQSGPGANLAGDRDLGSLKTNPFVLTPVSTCPSIESSAWPLLLYAHELVGEDGEWVFFVNVGWHRPSGVALNKTHLDQSVLNSGQFNWFYSLEMTFIPKDNWRVRANISLDSNDMNETLNHLTQKLDPVHIGVSLAFDYTPQSQVVLDLGYGRPMMTGNLPFMLAGSPLSIQAPDSTGFSDIQVVTACLRIEF